MEKDKEIELRDRGISGGERWRGGGGGEGE